jgi:hypothetical protein
MAIHNACAWRWIALGVWLILAPLALVIIHVLGMHYLSFFHTATGRAASQLIILAAIPLAGGVPLMALPLPRRQRIATTIVYVAFMAFLSLAATVYFGCVMYGNCM